MNKEKTKIHTYLEKTATLGLHVTCKRSAESRADLAYSSFSF